MCELAAIERADDERDAAARETEPSGRRARAAVAAPNPAVGALRNWTRAAGRLPHATHVRGSRAARGAHRAVLETARDRMDRVRFERGRVSPSLSAALLWTPFPCNTSNAPVPPSPTSTSLKLGPLKSVPCLSRECCSCRFGGGCLGGGEVDGFSGQFFLFLPPPFYLSRSRPCARPPGFRGVRRARMRTRTRGRRPLHASRTHPGSAMFWPPFLFFGFAVMHACLSRGSSFGTRGRDLGERGSEGGCGFCCSRVTRVAGEIEGGRRSNGGAAGDGAGNGDGGGVGFFSPPWRRIGEAASL